MIVYPVSRSRGRPRGGVNTEFTFHTPTRDVVNSEYATPTCFIRYGGAWLKDGAVMSIPRLRLTDKRTEVVESSAKQMDLRRRAERERKGDRLHDRTRKVNKNEKGKRQSPKKREADRFIQQPFSETNSNRPHYANQVFVRSFHRYHGGRKRGAELIESIR